MRYVTTISGIILSLLPILFLTACYTETLREIDREIGIDGSTDVIAEGVYEYTIKDSCQLIVGVCTFQSYTIRNVRLSGDSSIVLPASNPFNGRTFRIETLGAGVATATIQVLDDDGNLRDVPLQINSSYPDIVNLTCCENSLKIPVNETFNLRVNYFSGTTPLRASNTFSGINIPADISVGNIFTASDSNINTVNINMPSFKTRLNITSDFDTDLNVEVHIYDVFDVDEVVATTANVNEDRISLHAGVEIESIRPSVNMDFGYLYEIQTPAVCEFADSTLEKEGIEAAVIMRLQAGDCETRITLLGVIESQNPLVVNPSLDPVTAPSVVFTHTFE